MTVVVVKARPRVLTVREHETIEIDDSIGGSGLSSEEVDHLSRITELRPGFSRRGYRSVQLANYCGLVSIGERILEVLPKTDASQTDEDCRGILLRLLREADNFRVFRGASVAHHLRRATLLEVFIAAFFETVTDVVRGGLLRQYHEREDDLRVVRGRIAASRQFGVHFNRTDLISCEYDELTADNIWNRLIKTALRAVRPWITSIDLHRRWVELMAILDEVDDGRVSARALDRLVFHRQATRYRGVMEWVRWILSLMSPALRAGQNVAPALLFDMNRLFESAVAARLRREAAVDESVRVEAQATGRYLAVLAADNARSAYPIRPDIAIVVDGRVTTIADTKWKNVATDDRGYFAPEESDVYQMAAYSTAYQCDHLVLIYPWHAGLSRSLETVFELPSSGRLRPIITVSCIDIETDCLPIVRGAGPLSFDLESGRADCYRYYDTSVAGLRRGE